MRVPLLSAAPVFIIPTDHFDDQLTFYDGDDATRSESVSDGLEGRSGTFNGFLKQAFSSYHFRTSGALIGAFLLAGSAKKQNYIDNYFSCLL